MAKDKEAALYIAVYDSVDAARCDLDATKRW